MCIYIYIYILGIYIYVYIQIEVTAAERPRDVVEERLQSRLAARRRANMLTEQG